MIRPKGELNQAIRLVQGRKINKQMTPRRVREEIFMFKRYDVRL